MQRKLQGARRLYKAVSENNRREGADRLLFDLSPRRLLVTRPEEKELIPVRHG